MEHGVILIQGATDIDTEYLKFKCSAEVARDYNGYTFYEGEFNGYKIVVSKTGIGMTNSAISTMVGINRYNPICIINQGTAGSHVPDIHIGNLIIGECAVNVNTFSITNRCGGDISSSRSWSFCEDSYNVYADEELLDKFRSVEFSDGKRYIGTIGSGDIVLKEIDRIKWIHEQKNTLCEDMETVNSYRACKAMDVPVIGVRIISNNEITGEKIDKSQATLIQQYLLKKIDESQATLLQKYVLKVIQESF